MNKAEKIAFTEALDYIVRNDIIYLECDSHDTKTDAEVPNNEIDTLTYGTIYEYFLGVVAHTDYKNIGDWLEKANAYINYFSFEEVNREIVVTCIVEHFEQNEIKRCFTLN